MRNMSELFGSIQHVRCVHWSLLIRKTIAQCSLGQAWLPGVTVWVTSKVLQELYHHGCITSHNPFNHSTEYL